MARRPSADVASSTDSPTLPCDLNTWNIIASELELSAQQKRIVELVLCGHRDKQIAAELGLTFGTVRTYLKRVFDRVGVPDRLGLVLRIFAMAQSLPLSKKRPHKY